MEPKAKTSNRPIIVATAALTVAVGLTVASLGGYLRPRSAAPLAPATEEPVTAPATAATPEEPIFASYAPHEEREHARGHHHEREHEHEDD